MIDHREDARWCVYIHIVPRSVSGYDHDKYYVGVTSKDEPSKRWENGFGYRYNKHFFNAISKYGWDNLEHEIVANGLTKNEACQMEITLIAKLRSNKSRYGYNKTAGGEGVNGYKYSESQRKQKSEGMKGEKNHYYGKKHSDEIREKMSKNHRDFKGGNHPQAKRIWQFDLKGHFIQDYECGKDAAKALGTSDGMINAAIHRKTFYGYLWAQEDNVVINEDGVYMKEIPIIKPLKQKVFQFDLDGKYINWYDGYTDAQNKNPGFCRALIREVAIGKRKYHKGYLWKLEKDVQESEDTPGSFFIVKKEE